MAVKGSQATKTITTTVTKTSKPIGAKPGPQESDIISRLNSRQLRFCELYLSGIPANQAYLQAGYQVKNANQARMHANRLMTKDTVREYINRSKKEITKTYELNRGVLLETLMKIAMGEIDEEKAVTILNGNGTSKAFVVKQKTSPKDRAKAAEILLRIVAEDTPIQTQTVDDKIATALSQRKLKDDSDDANE